MNNILRKTIIILIPAHFLQSCKNASQSINLITSISISKYGIKSIETMKNISRRIILSLIICSFLQSCRNEPSIQENLVDYIVYSTRIINYSSEVEYKRGKLLLKNIETKAVENKNGVIKSILKQAQAIEKESNIALDLTDKVRCIIIIVNGGYKDNNPLKEYNNPTDVALTDSIMFGSDGTKSGAAYKIQRETNRFSENVNTILGKHIIDPIALDINADPCIYDKDKTKDFALYHFKNKPMIQALHELALLELKIINSRNYALNYLASQVYSN
jgi:hypothetical protein